MSLLSFFYEFLVLRDVVPNSTVKYCLLGFSRLSYEKVCHFPTECGFVVEKEKCRLESLVHCTILSQNFYSSFPSRPSTLFIHLGEIIMWSSTLSMSYSQKNTIYMCSIFMFVDFHDNFISPKRDSFVFSNSHQLTGFLLHAPCIPK